MSDRSPDQGESTEQHVGGRGRGGQRQAAAGNASRVSAQLLAIGGVMLLLAIGVRHFFDTLPGTVGYLLVLGLGVYGLLRWSGVAIPSDLRHPFPAASSLTARPTRRDSLRDAVRDCVRRGSVPDRLDRVQWAVVLEAVRARIRLRPSRSTVTLSRRVSARETLRAYVPRRGVSNGLGVRVDRVPVRATVRDAVSRVAVPGTLRPRQWWRRLRTLRSRVPSSSRSHPRRQSVSRRRRDSVVARMRRTLSAVLPWRGGDRL